MPPCACTSPMKINFPNKQSPKLRGSERENRQFILSFNGKRSHSHFYLLITDFMSWLLETVTTRGFGFSVYVIAPRDCKPIFQGGVSQLAPQLDLPGPLPPSVYWVRQVNFTGVGSLSKSFASIMSSILGSTVCEIQRW